MIIKKSSNKIALHNLRIIYEKGTGPSGRGLRPPDGGSGGQHLKYRRLPLMIKPNNRAPGAKGKHANRAGARWKCTPIGAALRLGFKGFRRFKMFKRFRGLWWRRSPQVIAAWRRQRCLSAAKTFTTGLSSDGNAPLSPPIGGTSPKGKHVTGFSVVYDSLRIQFLCHPGGTAI